MIVNGNMSSVSKMSTCGETKLPPISNILKHTSVPGHYTYQQPGPQQVYITGGKYYYLGYPNLPPIYNVMGQASFAPKLMETPYLDRGVDIKPDVSGSVVNKKDEAVEHEAKRKTRNNLPKETTHILLNWLNDHLNHPYPNSFEKNQLMMSTGLNHQQLLNWFINARRRKIKLLKEQRKLNS